MVGNYLAIAEALDLNRDDLVTLARNSIEATFLTAPEKAGLLAEIDAVAAGG